jgi:RimJ/RimL family protein N-acetyltransferase
VAALEFKSANPFCCELSYWTPVSQAKLGYATLASKLATLYAFDCLGAVRVQMSHDLKNVGSSRIAQKVGFRREGILRGLTRLDCTSELYEGCGDAVGYGLLREDIDELEWVSVLEGNCVYSDWSNSQNIGRVELSKSS